MKNVPPEILNIPSGRNFLRIILEGVISDFKKGRKVSKVEVSDLYSRADAMDRQNVIVVAAKVSSDG